MSLNQKKPKKSSSYALLLIQPAKADPEQEVDNASIPKYHEQQESGPAPIAQIFANMIASAKDEFTEGNADSGVIKILQALQLLTPRSK